MIAGTIEGLSRQATGGCSQEDASCDGERSRRRTASGLPSSIPRSCAKNMIEIILYAGMAQILVSSFGFGHFVMTTLKVKELTGRADPSGFSQSNPHLVRSNICRTANWVKDEKPEGSNNPELRRLGNKKHPLVCSPTILCYSQREESLQDTMFTIGVDIVEPISPNKRSLAGASASCSRFYSGRDRILRWPRSVAGRCFAAKEAVSKALGTGWLPSRHTRRAGWIGSRSKS